jgi:uncharacterized protein YndB with AHSA1/START domain
MRASAREHLLEYRRAMCDCVGLLRSGRPVHWWALRDPTTAQVNPRRSRDPGRRLVALVMGTQGAYSRHMKDPVARASVVVCAPRRLVWEALLRPMTVTKIMPVLEVVSGWRLGEPFEWTLELAGGQSRLQGVVHRIEAEYLLEYEYEDPHSRDFLQLENVHRVRIELSDDVDGTRVTVVQDANVTNAARAHAEGGWRMALNNLKGLVESASDQSPR